MYTRLVKKILVTGGAGFIGHKLVTELVNFNPQDQITIVDSLVSQTHGQNCENSYSYQRIKNLCRFVKCDLSSFSELNQLENDFEVVYHLASLTGNAQSIYEQERYNNNNIKATQNLLSHLSKGQFLKKIIRKLNWLAKGT